MNPPKEQTSARPALFDRAARFRTRIDCLHHLVSVARPASISVAIGALLLALWLYHLAPPALLGLWLFAMFGLAALRLLFARRFAQHFDETRESQVARWENGHMALTGLTGLIWGLSVWMPMNDPDHSNLLALTVILCGILLINSSALVASLKTFAGFTALLSLPLIVRLLTIGSSQPLMIGFGVLVMSIMVISAFRMHHDTLVAAFNSRHQSDHLLQQQRVIFESVGEGIVFLQPKPRYVAECNHRFAELFGYPLDAMPGMEPWRWHPDRAQWKTLVINSLSVIAEGRPYYEELQLQRADGSLFWGKVTGMAVDANNLSAGTVWIVSDISEKRATQAALRINEERFRDLVRLSSDLYWEQDEHFRFTHFDGQELIKHNLPVTQSIGLTRWEISGVLGVPEWRWKEHISTLERHEPFRDFIYQKTTPEGDPHWYSINGKPLFDAEGLFIGYHGTASDITSRIESEARFRHLAYHDPLTQLPNRRLLEDRLEQSIRNAHRNGHQLALLLIDLDKFKPINDQHGHASGDRVLETVAARLRACVRDTDTVARLGGDEFVVLLSSIEAAKDAFAVAEKIHASITEPISAGEHCHRVASSIGISLYPEHGDNVGALLHRADDAMYNGKQSGGETTRIYDGQRAN
jgi:diguanylate cyclase (GGDEF)-like protein/PAS domain S-box-containing protein